MGSVWYHDFMVMADLGTCGAENTHGHPMRDARAESGVMEKDLMNKKTGCAILRKMCYNRVESVNQLCSDSGSSFDP